MTFFIPTGQNTSGFSAGPATAPMLRCVALLFSFFIQPAAADPSLLSTYTLHCSGCHGTNGAGVPDKGIPNLADAGLYAGTPAGRAYLAQVPGISQSRLDNQASARILNYVLTRFSGQTLPADFRPYTASEMAVLRTHKASDAARLRHAILAQTDGAGLTGSR